MVRIAFTSPSIPRKIKAKQPSTKIRAMIRSGVHLIFYPPPGLLLLPGQLPCLLTGLLALPGTSGTAWRRSLLAISLPVSMSTSSLIKLFIYTRYPQTDSPKSQLWLAQLYTAYSTVLLAGIGIGLLIIPHPPPFPPISTNIAPVVVFCKVA